MLLDLDDLSSNPAYRKMPVSVLEALVKYAEERQPVEDTFILSCLRNNFKSAVLFNKTYEVDTLKVIVRFIVKKLPPQSWGSSEKVNHWLTPRLPGQKLMILH